MELHIPKVVTDGGPWADHDQACAVCREEPAVLDLTSGCFDPCWKCQTKGWKLVQRTGRFRKWLLNKLIDNPSEW